MKTFAKLCWWESKLHSIDWWSKKEMGRRQEGLSFGSPHKTWLNVMVAKTGSFYTLLLPCSSTIISQSLKDDDGKRLPCLLSVLLSIRTVEKAQSSSINKKTCYNIFKSSLCRIQIMKSCWTLHTFFLPKSQRKSLITFSLHAMFFFYQITDEIWQSEHLSEPLRNLKYESSSPFFLRSTPWLWLRVWDVRYLALLKI